MNQAEPERGQAPLAALVRALRAWGLGGLAAELLEHSGPLSFLGAQALYMAAPLGAGSHLTTWAEALEDPAAVRRLAGELRAPASQDTTP